MKVGCMLYQIFRTQAAVLFKCSAFRQNLHTTRREKIERDYSERGRRRRRERERGEDERKMHQWRERRKQYK